MAKTNSTKLNLQTLIVSVVASAIISAFAVYTWGQRYPTTAIPDQKTEEQQIIEAAKAYTNAKTITNEVDVRYDIRQVSNGFAQVSVSFSVNSNSTGGVTYFLKKSLNHWLVIYSGQNLPTKEVGESYGMPQGWYQN